MMRALSVVVVLAWARVAMASSFTELSDRADRPAEPSVIEIDGMFRLRGELLGNLDLDRGTTPSGAPLFPVPLGDPDGQMLTHSDLRLRTDLALNAPGGLVSVKLRVDVLDNLSLGSTPSGLPAETTRQQAPSGAFRIKHAYGQVLTPVGLLQAGRMGSSWGLGMLANPGDCDDCDSGDVGDRIAFVTPLFGHLWAFAYDLSATGALLTRKNDTRELDLDPSDDVRSVTFAILRYRTPLARKRRAQANKATLEYGAYVAHRWQNRDLPTTYLPTEGASQGFSPAQIMSRGYRATGIDGWMRLTTSSLRIEVEAALLLARFDQASLIPGVLLVDPVESRQIGAALESDWRPVGDALSIGLDVGFASGDPAPGFGAVVGPTDVSGEAGDLEGAQVSPPFDNRIDNFRFHRDYRIDRILFREIVGTVTDAYYVRPHAAWVFARMGQSYFFLDAAAVASFAVEATSTPGGASPLGLELDPTLGYASDDGFRVVLEYAVLFPFAGLDNPAAGLTARPAQLARAQLVYAF